MKLLDEDEMVQLLPASDSDLAALARRMRPLRDGAVPPWQNLEGSARGCEGTTVCHDGERIAVFWHWFSSGNNSLVINASASLVDRDVFPYIVAAGEKLARSMNATGLQFETRRRGLVEKARRYGYTVDGVLMRKELTL